ncbi:MAG: hypothetical protein O3C21_19960 [Verrucomicrobia bacterium]|nr:hypothetical protein [Verrucomicrobiota bacterium]
MQKVSALAAIEKTRGNMEAEVEKGVVISSLDVSGLRLFNRAADFASGSSDR